MKEFSGHPKLFPKTRTNLLQNIPTTLGELLDWPELFEAYPPLAQVPVIPTLPEKENPRWTRAATLARKDNGGFAPRSRIIIHPTREKFPNRYQVLRCLVHETCHLIQCLEGRWVKEHLHHQTDGYDTHPLELEARAFVKKHIFKGQVTEWSKVELC
jgi:hypothetical protein